MANFRHLGQTLYISKTKNHNLLWKGVWVIFLKTSIRLRCFHENDDLLCEKENLFL